MATISPLTRSSPSLLVSLRHRTTSAFVADHLQFERQFPLAMRSWSAEQIATPLLPPAAAYCRWRSRDIGRNQPPWSPSSASPLLSFSWCWPAQFESFVASRIIMATVPLGLACAIFALLLSPQSSMPTARSAWCCGLPSCKTASSSSNSQPSARSWAGRARGPGRAGFDQSACRRVMMTISAPPRRVPLVPGCRLGCRGAPSRSAGSSAAGWASPPARRLFLTPVA